MFVLCRTKLQDPLVLFEPKSLRMVLQEWLSQLEKTFDMKDFSGISDTGNLSMTPNQDVLLLDDSKKGILDEDSEKEKRNSLGNEETVDPTACESVNSVREPLDDFFRVCSPCCIANSLQKDLAELTTLCLELNVLNSEIRSTDGDVDHTLQQCSPEILACQFLKKYFFLLDLKRAKESIKLCYTNSPCVWDTFIEGLKGNNQIALPKIKLVWSILTCLSINKNEVENHLCLTSILFSTQFNF